MNRMIVAVATILVAAVAGSVIAHPATERYIPIGYWQKVSDRQTYIGEIESHDATTHALMVEGAKGHEGYRAVRLTERTRIYLDRSQLKMTNLEGSYADCRPGRTVEVNFAGTGEEALWIKVLITER